MAEPQTILKMKQPLAVKVSYLPLVLKLKIYVHLFVHLAISYMIHFFFFLLKGKYHINESSDLQTSRPNLCYTLAKKEKKQGNNKMKMN